MVNEFIKVFGDRLKQCDSLGKYDLFTKEDIIFLLNHIKHQQQRIKELEN